MSTRVPATQNDKIESAAPISDIRNGADERTPRPEHTTEFKRRLFRKENMLEDLNTDAGVELIIREWQSG